MLLNIILNILLVGFIIGGVYFGCRRGFIGIAARPIKVFAAIAITVACCGSVGEALVKPVIDAPITNYVSDYLYENCGGLDDGSVGDELPTLLKMAAGISGIDVEQVASDAKDGGRAVIDALADVLTDPVINMISVVIAFVLIYIASKIALGLLLRLINHSLRRGVLGWVNKTVGSLFGLLLSIIICWGAVALLEFVFHSPLFAENSTFSEFDGVFLYGFFKDFNPIELLLSF